MKVIRLRKAETQSFQINKKSDKIVAMILLSLAIFCYFFFSNRTAIERYYLISLLWYIFAVFCIVRVRVFSGIGFYVLYLLFFVQYGFLLQKYYFVFSPTTVTIASSYNAFAPLLLILLFRYTNIKKTELRQKRINQTWVQLLYYVGVVACLLFFISARGIPLFANDAENYRVTAVSGRGFLVIIADACLELAIMLTQDGRTRNKRAVLAILLLFGTGYRSQSLTIVLMLFVTYWIGKGKKYFLSGSIVIVVIGLLYSLIGVTRSGIGWRWQTLYMPVIWRLYVNANNFNQIVLSFPKGSELYGASFLMDLSILLPGAQKSFMLQMKDILGLTYAGGSFTPGVFGEGYANFGSIGAVIWSISMLLIVLILDRFLRNRVDGRAYFALAFCLAGPSTSSFLSSMMMSFIPKLLVYLTLEYLSRKRPIVIRL